MKTLVLYVLLVTTLFFEESGSSVSY